MFWIDKYYIILVLPTVILALYAQAKVSSAFNQYSQVRSRRGMTGQEVALSIMRSAGIMDVPVEMVSGHLTDHYDPRSRVLRLSESVCNRSSIAAVGVAAHEAGHAIQHQVGYAPLHIRNAIIPLTRLGSNLSMPLIVAGIVMGGLSSRGSDFGWYMILLGIALFGVAVLFQVITLPVEFNASSRALRLLGELQILAEDEVPGARRVLQAAALTYVAATAQALANLLRLLLIVGGRNRRDD